MPINDTIKLITKSIADASNLPAMGPSNNMLRDSGFRKGLALVDGDFITYGAARKVALVDRAHDRATRSRTVAWRTVARG